MLSFLYWSTRIQVMRMSAESFGHFAFTWNLFRCCLNFIWYRMQRLMLTNSYLLPIRCFINLWQVKFISFWSNMAFQMVEPFTAHYVFALGVARFLGCAHWMIQVSLHILHYCRQARLSFYEIQYQTKGLSMHNSFGSDFVEGKFDSISLLQGW